MSGAAREIFLALLRDEIEAQADYITHLTEKRNEWLLDMEMRLEAVRRNEREIERRNQKLRASHALLREMYDVKAQWEAN